MELPAKVLRWVTERKNARKSAELAPESRCLMVEKSENFESMMRENGPRVYSLAVRLTGNLADGQDLAQDTFLRAYKSWENFRGDSDSATWLYRVCVNTWKNRVRYESRRSFWKHFSLDGNRREDEQAPELPSHEAPLDRTLETTDRQTQLRTALAQLEPQERAIVVLRDIEERSYEEIAALLEVPVGTVKSRLARSRDKLRDLLKSALKE